MNPIRQTVLRRLLPLGALLLCIAPAMAQVPAYPAQPIRVIVPFPPAGGTDTLTRLITAAVTAKNGWNFVIENRPGAGGNIGIEAVVGAKPDGYTLGTAQTSNMAISPALYSKLAFNSLKDLTPVVLLASQPLVIVVRADSKITRLADLKAAPGAPSLTLASPGVGTVGHIAGEMFARAAGTTLLHVAYRGAGPALNDVMAGQVDVYFGTPPSVMPLIKAGKLRALAITGLKRMPVLPNVPTVDESGYRNFVAEDWKAIVAPVGTPPAVVKQLNEAINLALGQTSLIAKLLEEGSTPRGGTPQALGAFIKSEHARWGQAVLASGAKAE